MSGRRIFAAIFIVVSVVGMVARYQYDKAEKRKREEMLRSLASMTREAERERLFPTPEPTVEEPRDVLDSTLPQEYLEQIRQAVGQDFKLLDLRVHEMGLSAKVSTDGETVKEYRRWKHRKNVEGPFDVKIIGDGKVEDNLLKPADVDLSLVPKLSKEAFERAAFPDSKVDGASIQYPLFRTKGQGPEWTVNLSAKRGEKWEFKNVTFDAKGRFKEVRD